MRVFICMLTRTQTNIGHLDIEQAGFSYGLFLQGEAGTAGRAFYHPDNMVSDKLIQRLEDCGAITTSMNGGTLTLK